jgi:hypothetical protein
MPPVKTFWACHPPAADLERIQTAVFLWRKKIERIKRPARQVP